MPVATRRRSASGGDGLDGDSDGARATRTDLRLHCQWHMLLLLVLY